MFDGITRGDQFIERLVVSAETFVSKMLDRGGAPLMGDIVAEAMRNPELAAQLREGSAPFRARLAEEISAGQERGDFDRSIAAEQAARIISGGLDGMCMRIVMRGEGERREVGADVRELLCRVLLPPAQFGRGVEKPTRKSTAAPTTREKV
jgi:hypothetical protein